MINYKFQWKGIPVYVDPYMKENEILKGRKENKEYFLIISDKIFEIMLKQKEKIDRLVSKVDNDILLKNGIDSISIISENQPVARNLKPWIYINYSDLTVDVVTEEELILKLEEILKIREEKLKRILKK